MALKGKLVLHRRCIPLLYYNFLLATLRLYSHTRGGVGEMTARVQRLYWNFLVDTRASSVNRARQVIIRRMGFFYVNGLTLSLGFSLCDVITERRSRVRWERKAQVRGGSISFSPFFFFLFLLLRKEPRVKKGRKKQNLYWDERKIEDNLSF